MASYVLLPCAVALQEYRADDQPEHAHHGHDRDDLLKHDAGVVVLQQLVQMAN